MFVMRKYFVFINMFYLACSANAQIDKSRLVGLWQAGFATVTSMNLDTYHFLDNGRFVFKPNEYNGLNRIICIVGKYSLKGTKLLLTPDSTQELLGGFPTRSEFTTLSDAWEISEGKIKMIACKKKIEQAVGILACQNDSCVLLDDRKYYRIGK